MAIHLGDDLRNIPGLWGAHAQKETNKLQPVTQVLYPILTALLGFMSGYFAGSGKKGARPK